MKFTIRTKLIAILLGLTLAVLVVVISAINNVFSRTINESVVLDFAQLRGFFQVQQNLQYDRLAESSFLISENSSFKANVALHDPPSVEQSLFEFSRFAKADLFIVTDDHGEVLSWLGRPDSTGTDITHRETVQTALKGIDPPVEIKWPQLWAIDDLLYQVVTIPVFEGGSSITGTITLGTIFKDIEAQNLKENTTLDVVMYLDEMPIAYSDSVMNKYLYQDVAVRYESLIDSLTNNTAISEPFRLMIGNTEFLAFISPLGIGERAYYIAYVPAAKQFEILSELQRNILIIALISIFVVIPFSILLARVFSDPIKNLTDAMIKVSEGDLNVSLTPKTNDEIGILTKAFNEMIIGLRERFALSKYVGDHTLKMISKTSDRELHLGGAREELAILFTDIRGSTKKIATSGPETFISILNRTLTSQADAVIDQGGSIDKFVGDSLIALFSGENALERAILCGQKIQSDYKNDEEVNKFFDGLGIGINYGPMVLGNMGANERMDYTVIGPEVNLCARLCAVADSGQILIPVKRVTEMDLEAKFEFRPVESKALKGFENEIEIVEVLYE